MPLTCQGSVLPFLHRIQFPRFLNPFHVQRNNTVLGQLPTSQFGLDKNKYVFVSAAGFCPSMANPKNSFACSFRTSFSLLQVSTCSRHTKGGLVKLQAVLTIYAPGNSFVGS